MIASRLVERASCWNGDVGGTVIWPWNGHLAGTGMLVARASCPLSIFSSGASPSVVRYGATGYDV
ncbi:hypothetical protein [Moorena sp. SIO4G3]|uniref:hypothetical protein n=1 Tax=Moorena sp. SIO4G3 TaxID=2607821 RepID=UPI00142A1115|nr:hypothetical protein [Moorena sp. SIO4G3]NEO75051.1 hypothetical protein [Moorena sp. SIO4G3]